VTVTIKGIMPTAGEIGLMPALGLIDAALID